MKHAFSSIFLHSSCAFLWTCVWITSPFYFFLSSLVLSWLFRSHWILYASTSIQISEINKTPSMATVVWIRYGGVFLVFSTLTCCKVSLHSFRVWLVRFFAVKRIWNLPSPFSPHLSYILLKSINMTSISSFPLMHTRLPYVNFFPTCIHCMELSNVPSLVLQAIKIWRWPRNETTTCHSYKCKLLLLVIILPVLCMVDACKVRTWLCFFLIAMNYCLKYYNLASTLSCLAWATICSVRSSCYRTAYTVSVLLLPCILRSGFQLPPHSST